MMQTAVNMIKEKTLIFPKQFLDCDTRNMKS